MTGKPARPDCGTLGRRVTPVTLDALVAEEALARLERPDGFHFCFKAGCSVAYYDGGGQ